MSPLTHRAASAVGTTLDDNRARPGIIANGVHVHEGALRVAYRQKGANGHALVTDAMEAAGMPPGEHELSGRKVRLQDGALRLPDGALTMYRAVRNAVALLGVSPQTAVRMASESPAEILDMPEKGRIGRGADAAGLRRLRLRPKSVGSGSPAGPTGSITCATISRRAIASCAIE